MSWAQHAEAAGANLGHHGVCVATAACTTHSNPVKHTLRDWSVPPPNALPISSSAREEFPRGTV